MCILEDPMCFACNPYFTRRNIITHVLAILAGVIIGVGLTMLVVS